MYFYEYVRVYVRARVCVCVRACVFVSACMFEGQQNRIYNLFEMLSPYTVLLELRGTHNIAYNCNVNLRRLAVLYLKVVPMQH